ncbi:MAG TPA: DinB family protein [Gemmatimonadaceae bacterium]
MAERQLVKSIDAEYRRYKALAESALAQVPEESLSAEGLAGGNSLAIICWHLGGNLQSRFTDFLTSDGEKPWRQREEEFARRTVSRDELLEKWNAGWSLLFSALDDLSDDDLVKSVTIRGQSLAVHEALHRSLAHASYHVGQIVYLAHAIVGGDWKYLSIPPGGSSAYNANPQFEKPASHAKGLTDSK